MLQCWCYVLCIHDFCLRNALQHVSRKEATKRMTFVEQAVREGGLEGWWKRRPRTPLAEALSACQCVHKVLLWVLLGGEVMVPSKSPAGEEACALCAKAAQKMEEARLHEAIEAGTKQRSNWTWHESHISHESHWHFDNIFNYFDIFYAVSRWKRAFLCDIHWCHWCLAGFMQEVGPVPISDLSDPFVRSVCHKNTGSLSGSWFPGQCRWRWRNPSVAETSFSCVQPCQRVKWHLGGSVESSVTVGSVFYCFIFILCGWMLDTFLKDSIDSMLNVSGLASYDEGFRSKVRSQQLADMDDMLTWPSEKMSIQTDAFRWRCHRSWRSWICFTVTEQEG